MPAESYDVIIVGSGAGGGMSGYELTRRGLKVLMLEAGRDYDPVTETPMFETPEQAPLRAEPTPDKPFGFYDATVGGGWQVPGEPYTVAPGSAFKWWRPRMAGGRTNHWGRVALRFGPYDFKPFSRDGLGVDWPIGHEDVTPWYDKVERLIGVTGGPPQGLENIPDAPPGCQQPAPPPRAFEILVTRAFAAMNVPTAPIHAAVLTQPLGDRPACIYATHCVRGCQIKANFQSTTVLIPPAIDTGKLTLRSNAMVYQVDIDKSGKASGVSFIDKTTGEHHSVTARAVVLAAGACETSRILLNSKSARFPNGVGNDHGLVGKYLMDSAGTFIGVQVPALEGLPPTNDDGISVSHIYVPWWGHSQQADKKLDFPRGYHVEMYGGRLMPSMFSTGLLDGAGTSRGDELRQTLRKRYGNFILFLTWGEIIPNEDSFVDIDPTTKDKWGIPVLRFHWKWGEAETRQTTHAVKTMMDVTARMGGKLAWPVPTDGAKAISTGGEIIHEVGTARMGDSPTNSVVNSYGQSWAVSNLFLMDGSVFPSSPDKNPTLTILALAWRNSAHLADLAKKGQL